MRDGNTLEEVPTDKNGITLAVAVMGARAKIFEDRPSHDDEELQQLEKEYVELARAYQRDAFPKLRKAMASALNDVMWEHDIEVAAFGGRNKKMKLTGGIFASNRGIKMAQEGLQDTPRMLRFNETRYEWYKGSDYQYFSYDDAIDDDTWAAMTGAGWRKFD